MKLNLQIQDYIGDLTITGVSTDSFELEEVEPTTQPAIRN